MNVSREKLAGTLQKVFPFNDLEKKHIDLLLDNAEMVFFHAEKMVYLEGTPASFFYILYHLDVTFMYICYICYSFGLILMAVFLLGD